MAFFIRHRLSRFVLFVAALLWRPRKTCSHSGVRCMLSHIACSS